MTNSIFKTLRKYRIPKTVKRVFNFVGGLFLTTCCFFVAYLTFQNGWTDLNKVDKFEGIIIEKGITTNQTSTSGRYRTTLNNKVFYLKLEGLNQTLAVYNPKQDYVSLDNSLYVGDTVKVFYNHSNLVDKLNLETFQIEKNNQEILNSQDFQGRERIGFYITLLGGFVLLFLTFYQDRKFRLNK
jgi:tRNA(Ile2) C34 agmatinyltransferase TiaS